MIDLRSDICSQPTEPMWEAMRAARLGWATFGEDESVERLHRVAAELLGKEASLWVPTCGMANLVALMTLREPGARVALHAESHIATREAMGVENVARLEPVPLEELTADAVAGAGAALLCLENTHTRAGGTVLGVEETAALAAAAPLVHVDGARLANAAVALGIPLATLVRDVDTVALSLNKGLCAPMGAMLAGPAGTIERARWNLRRLGGATVHKAGIAAAAGLVALDTMLDRLADDHRRARALAERLVRLPGVSTQRPETNIVFFAVAGLAAATVIERLQARGVRAYERDAQRVRFVTHRLIDDEAVDAAVAAVAAAAAE